MPTEQAISKAALAYHAEKKARGRKEGWRKTTKKEDRTILKTFHKLRPPGHGIDSRTIHKGLKKKIRKKVSRRTIRNRLAEKGYVPKAKVNNNDPGPKLQKKRLAIAQRFLERTGEDWNNELQAVGGKSGFTWYPKVLQARFKQLRAAWTYMKANEVHKPAFVRPKRWFKPKEYKLTRKQEVFGFTTSNGKSLCFLVPKPWSTELWAAEIKNKVAPFLRAAFPDRASFTILLDGEYLLHGPAAKRAMAEAGIKIFDGWPGYSPDMNPQENVWAWVENELRRLENDDDPFPAWTEKLLKACRAYPAKGKLVATMAKRMKETVERKGAMTSH